MGCCGRAARQLLGLVGEGPPARVHLEQDRLGRLAREPELAALGVVAVALGRDHRSVPRVEQLRGRDEPESVEQAQGRRIAGRELAERPGALDGRRRGRGGVAVDDHGEAAEPVLAGALEQLEAALRVAGEHGGGAPRECGGDRTLRARLCLERREGERLARGCERARRRWNPFALGDRALERLQPLLDRARPLRDIVALRCRGPGRSGRLVGARLELGRREPAAARDRARLLELARQRLDERCRRLLPQAEPLARGTERDEPAVGAFLASGRAGERRLDATTLGAQLGKARLGVCSESRRS